MFSAPDGEIVTEREQSLQEQLRELQCSYDMAQRRVSELQDHNASLQRDNKQVAEALSSAKAATKQSQKDSHQKLLKQREALNKVQSAAAQERAG